MNRARSLSERPASSASSTEDLRSATPPNQAAVAVCPTCGGSSSFRGRLALRIGETAKAFGVSRDFIELCLETGTLEAIRLRSLRLVTVDSILRLRGGKPERAIHPSRPRPPAAMASNNKRLANTAPSGGGVSWEWEQP